jgi:hypothetical protein
MKSLVGKTVTEKIKFMGEDLVISKLTVAQVKEIQDVAKAEAEKGDNDDSMAVMRTIIRASVAAAVDLEDNDFEAFPLDELSKLSNRIMSFSGVGDKQGK